MAKKNRILNNIRLSPETDNLLGELSTQLELSKSSLARLLLNRSLRELKQAAITAGGLNKLTFEVRANEL